ncbi:hypothetical protein GCM10010191_44390 [Actinomadura vinacea]|uniref:Uncharacterized protein n=1 Tax=Actinomadura vinacea TaxID=115336 RepID=A0ABP5WJQ6_9ACTN
MEKPLVGSPVRMAPLPAFSGDEEAGRARTDQGQGYFLGAEIGELVRSGALREITGPGGERARPYRPRITVRRRTDLVAPQASVEQRPRPYDEERYDELVQRLGRILMQISPEGWERIDLQVRMVASVSEGALTVVMADGVHAEVEPVRDFSEIAAELRSMLYRPDRGTWFGMRFTMSPPSEYWVSFNDRFDPEWSPPLPAEAWRHDLSVFPRADEHIPAWLRDRIAEDG